MTHVVMAGQPETTEGAYGAVLRDEWWREVVSDHHPGDRSLAFWAPPTASEYDGSSPLVLLHGVGNNGAVFSPIMSTLAEFGPVVAPTMSPDLLRDVGPKRRDVSAGLVDWLSEIVAPPWRLVGHSMGGLMTGLVLRTHPELVSSAVLLNAPLPGVVDRIRGSDSLDRTGRALLFMRLLNRVTSFGRPRLPRRLRAAELAVVRQAMRGFVHDPGELNDRVLSRAVLGSRTTDGIEFLELAEELPAWEAEPFTDVPVHIVLGGTDPLVPEVDHEAVRASYPAATIQVLEECGHFAHLEWPHQVVDAIVGHLALTRP